MVQKCENHASAIFTDASSGSDEMTKLQFQVFYYLTFYDGSFPFEQVYDFCEFDRDGTLNYAEFEYCFCYTNDAEIEQYFLD